MEGTTLAAAARRILPDAQIVFATAYSQYGVKAFELGVNNYILKPFDPDRVRRVLEKCQKDLQKNQALTAATVPSCDDHQLRRAVQTVFSRLPAGGGRIRDSRLSVQPYGH